MRGKWNGILTLKHSPPHARSEGFLGVNKIRPLEVVHNSNSRFVCFHQYYECSWVDLLPARGQSPQPVDSVARAACGFHFGPRRSLPPRPLQPASHSWTAPRQVLRPLARLDRQPRPSLRCRPRTTREIRYSTNLNVYHSSFTFVVISQEPLSACRPTMCRSQTQGRCRLFMPTETALSNLTFMMPLYPFIGDCSTQETVPTMLVRGKLSPTYFPRRVSWNSNPSLDFTLINS